MLTQFVRILLDLGDRWRDWCSRRDRLTDDIWRSRRSAARWEAKHRR